MTNEELASDWRNIAVIVDGKQYPLKDQYAMCWGWTPDLNGLLFDRGGSQGAEAHVFIVGEGDTLISVDPQNPNETCEIGKLVRIEENLSEKANLKPADVSS